MGDQRRMLLICPLPLKYISYSDNFLMLCNSSCLKRRLRLLCNKSSTAQQLEPRFKDSLSYVTYLFWEYCIEIIFRDQIKFG